MLDKDFYSRKAEEFEAMARALRKMAEYSEQDDLFEEGELDGGSDDQGYSYDMDKTERATKEDQRDKDGLVNQVISNTAKEPVDLGAIRKVLVKKKQSGFADEIKALLSEFGVAKVSDLEESKYREFYVKAKFIGEL